MVVPWWEVYPAGGEPVAVYRNLRKRSPSGGAVYSVMDVASRRVIAHTASIGLADVCFEVRAGGRERVRVSGHKNVHAFAVGVPVLTVTRPRRRGTYNPHTDDGFIDAASGQALHTARVVVLDGEGMRYRP